MKKDYKVFEQFLKAQIEITNYTPKDKHFTSEKEIKYITDLLALNEMDVEEMREMRNMVVLYYRHLIDGLIRGSELWEKYWQGMMSITAIIDHVSHGETA